MFDRDEPINDPIALTFGALQQVMGAAIAFQ
ncbi:hypothetical protein KR52_13055 [Synechococcus sp. KORDI-52]|nr:hypothetical protein KR52_13055 [Synechococcus sp. KORDI-52]